MILKLSFKDIVHDRLLSICLILTIASIIAPLLILFGIKFGTIQTMRGRLIEDPVNREIRPVTTSSFHRDWFSRIRTEIPEIDFIVPMTRQISTAVDVRAENGKKSRLSLMPTGPGDPLLLENRTAIPDTHSCVLTAPAAETLAVVVGDELTLSAKRIIGGKTGSGDFSLHVSGILSERAGGLKSVYVLLPLVEAVEDFKDGRAVPLYGWSGELPMAYPVFQGAVVFTHNQFSKMEEILLVNNTGFSTLDKIAPDQMKELVGFVPESGWNGYLLKVKKRAAGMENIKALHNKLRGKGAVILPWNSPMKIALTPEGGTPASFTLYGVNAKMAAITSLDLTALYPNGEHLVHGQRTVLAATSSASGERVMAVEVEKRQLTLPVEVAAATLPANTAFTSASLLGKLNLLRSRNITYDANADRLLLARRGYAGFRLYTESIDAVAAVQHLLEEEGISVHTRRERIAEVRRLDHYMSLIFWLIAVVGVIGGISALTASLYASVERKKKELNILRLLGLLKREIIRFPVYQGLMLSGIGVGLAALVFGLVAGVINRLFSSHLQSAESLCTLSGFHFMILAVGVACCAVVSASLAALQATRLDPAEALRDE